jgi:hypothetical protein
VWSAELDAFSTMFREGYISAPPTITVCSTVCAAGGSTFAVVVSAGPQAATSKAAQIAVETASDLTDILSSCVALSAYDVGYGLAP